MSDIEITVEKIQSWTVVVRAETEEDALDFVQEQLNINGRDKVTELLQYHEPINTIWQTNGVETQEHDDGHDPDFDLDKEYVS